MAKIPTTDPFANLFGKPTTIQKTTVTGKIPKEDPFKDLFKKTETETVETPKVETKKIVIPGALDTTGKTTSMFKNAKTPTIKPTIPLEQKITTPGLKETKPSIMGGKVIGTLENKPSEVSPKEDEFSIGKTLKDFAYWSTIGSLDFITSGARAITDVLGGVGGAILADINMPTGGDKTKVSPKEVFKEGLRYAKNDILSVFPEYKSEYTSQQSINDAAQLYLKSSGIKSVNDIKAENIITLAGLGIMNMFGDIALSPLTFKAAKKLKEFATYKKVGEVSKTLPEGTTFVGKGKATIPISEDLKMIVNKADNSITFTGYMKRGFKPTITPGNLEIGATEDAGTTVQKLISSFKGNADVIVKGSDLVIKSTVEGATNLIYSISEGAQPIAKSLMMTKDVLSDPNVQNILSPENLVKAQTDFNSYVDQNKIPVVSTDKVNIEVIEFPDKTWGYSYNINTDNGISADFISNPTVKSKDEAINMAKNEVSKFIDTQLSEAPEEIKTDLITTKEAIMPKEITHGSRVPVEQILKEGFIFGKNSEFGEAAFFSTSTETSDLHGAGNVIKIDPKEFNLITIDTVEQKNNIIKEQGAKNLADAVRSMGYDGAIYTHPDPKVGDTYIITNKEKLDTVIREKYPVEETVEYPVEQKVKPTREITSLIDNYARGEAEVNRINSLLSGRERPDDPKLFDDLNKKIEEIETGNRSVVKQISKLVGSTEYDTIQALGDYIDIGKRRGNLTITDFYNNIKVSGIISPEIEPQEVVQTVNKEKITNIPIEKLTSYEGAPDLEQVNKYKSDIQAGKTIEPIKVIYEKDGTIGIEDGKHRFEAYKQLGYKEVPTVDVTKTIQERAKEVETKKKAAKVTRFGKTKAVPPQTTAMKIVQKKSSLPIIQNLMVKNGKMYSTNLETSLELNTDLPDGIYRSDGKNIAITDQDINDFPESPFDKVTENAGTLKLEDLSSVLKEAARIIDIKQPRIEIHGLYIKVKDGKATTISTDGYRAYIKTIDIKDAKDGEYILNNAKDISKVISALGDNPKMYVADNTMKFVGDNGQVITQRLVGKYPDVSQIFPIFNKQLSVDKKELLNVLDEMKFFVKPKETPIVKVIPEDNKLILEVNGNKREISLKQKDIKTDGKMEDGELLMPIHDTGDIEMRFNIAYLKDAINSVPNDNINLLTPDSLTNPILVKEPGIMKRITKPITKIEKPIGNRSIDGFNPTNLEEPTSSKAKIETDKIIKRSDIAEELSKKLNVPIRRGKFNRQAIGLFKREPKVIRIKSGGLSTIFHEVGHFLDDEFKLSNNISAKERRSLMKEYGFTYEGDPEKQRREALAEYLRFKMTGQTDKIKEFAPEFDKEFNTRIDQLPEVKAVLDKAAQDFQRWLDQPAVAKVLSNISLGEGNKGRLIDRINNKLHALYTDAKDSLHPLDEFTKIGKRRFGTIPAEADPYILARNSRGWVGKADTFLNKGTFGKDYYKVENGKVKVNFKGKSLSEILKPIENAKKMDEFRVYLVSKRTIELSDRGIKTGISRQDAEEAIKELEAKNPEFEQASKDLYKYQDEVLQYAKETGLIGEEGYAKIVEFNKYRVPFYRVMEESRSAYMGGKKVAGNINAPIRKIKGSERDIIDPIEGIIKDTYAIINAAERNNIGIAMANLASRDPELGRLFEQVDRKMVGTKVNVKEVLNKAIPEVKDMIPEDIGNEVVTIFRPTDDMGNNMINVNMGDKKLTFQVDPDLYRALQGLNEEDMGTIIKILSLPAKLLRAGATLSPDFSVRNPIRDQFSAFIYSNYGFKPGIDLIKGMFEIFKKGDVYDLWKISGGENAMMVSMDRKYLQSTFKDVVRSKGGKAFEYVKHPIELLRAISEIGEEATRLGEMKNALEKGATPTEAAFASREITLDFARVGAKTKAINSIVAFWNANLEGTDKLIRSFKTHPFRTLFRILVGITIPSVLLYMANKDDPRWKEIPQWQKDLFWIVFTPEHIYRIPKPFEVGTLFGSVPERTLDVMDENDPEMFKELNKSIMDGFTPGFIPTSLIPIIENITNYSFFSERPIVSEGKQTLPAKAQYNTYTSETAKLIGDVLNYSPAKIDNLIQGYTGGLGKYSIQILDKVLQGTGISEKTVVPAKGLEDQPVIKAFMIRPPVGTSSESVNRLYTKYNELSTKYNYVSKLQEDGNIEKAKKYIEENPDIINKVVVDAAIKSFSYINSTRDKIRSSNNISAEDKRLKILKLDTLETEIAVKILKQINGENNR